MSGGGGWGRGLGAVVVGVVALLVLLIIGAAEDDTGPELSGVDTTKIPPLAKRMLPVINDVVDRQCPELPAVWVVAEIQAESSWNPKAHSDDSNGGATGLYQINARNWAAAGGKAGDSTVPETHLRVGIPWVCTNLRAITEHLRTSGKPTDPLDAMLVCHIAGCGRVTGSATGVPRAGEAGCGPTCASLVARYLANVHRYVEEFSTAPGTVGGRTPAPPPRAENTPAGPEPPVARADPAVVAGPVSVGDPGVGAPAAGAGQAEPAAVLDGPGGAAVTIGGITTAALPAAPAAFPGPVTGCMQTDPTGDGCLTATTAHGLSSLVAAFGDFRTGPSLRSAGCWNPHAWNPTSDHAKGKACDLFPAAPGKFAEGAALDGGWRMANWYRSHAGALHVKYLIWQGRYWDPSSKDSGGWGTRYTGGGVYNVRDATGGHYDHIHVSYRD